MKLTEQQLAHLFQQRKDVPVESVIDDLDKFSHASDSRLKAVEKIANNSTLSASQHLVNNMQEWSKTVSAEIQTHLQPSFTSQFLKWLQPTVAVAAIVTAVYFITPIYQHESQTPKLSVQTQKSDRIMYSSSFEKGNPSFKTEQHNNDVIAKFDFS